MMICWSNLDTISENQHVLVKKYTNHVDKSSHIKDMMMYIVNLILIKSCFSKFFFAFKENEVTLQNPKPTIFDVTIPNPIFDKI